MKILTDCAAHEPPLQSSDEIPFVHDQRRGASGLAVHWPLLCDSVGGHTCAHVETAVTDRDGRFRTGAWSSEPVALGDRDMRYDAYKPGMEMSYVRPGTTLEMRTFPGSREERLKELQRASRTALCSRQPSEGIADLKDAIATEIQALVRTPSDESTYLVEARALARSEREAAANFDRHARPGRGDR